MNLANSRTRRRNNNGWLFNIGEIVQWEYKTGAKKWSGTGIVLEREWYDPGFSSPADRYLIQNSDNKPFPFYLAELGEVRTAKFIHGFLDAVDE